METLKRIADVIDAINERVGRGVSWVTAGLVLVVFGDVVMRYVFNISFVFTQELEWHLFGFIFLIGAGYTLLHEGHVRVDILYQRFKPKTKAWVNLFGCLIFLFPGVIMIFTTSLDFVHSAISVWEGSPDPGGIPLRFIIKSCIPAGMVLLFFQGISLFIHSLLIIKGLEEPSEEGGLG